MARHWEDAWHYANQIIDGDIAACKWVRLACQRFIDDMHHGHQRGLVFSPEKAQDVLDYYDLTPHIKGEWAGQSITPSDWQTFALVNLFGWYRADGTRRFRSGYIEVGRKNGKSTFVAPVGLYMLKEDGEAGSEVYSAATSRDQARIVFDAARDMTRQSSLRYHLQAYNHSVCHEASASSFKPLASDSDTLEGKNTHCAIIDELHAHKNRRVYDVLELSCAARRQPLLLVITTAGSDRTGICYEVRNYLTKVLEGVIDDDSCFGMIYTLDDPEQWKNPDEWIKANPNLGISVKLEDIKRLCQKAQQNPAAASEFKRKRLDIWGAGEDVFFNMEMWTRCPPLASDDQLLTMPCYFGLDLASKLDITALVALFCDDDRRYHIKVHFWLPEVQIDDQRTGKSHHVQQLYKVWAEQGLLTLTPGQIVDYDAIRQTINDWADRYHPLEIAYDPWGATQLATQLADDDDRVMTEVGQTVKQLSDPMKEVQALIIDSRLHHDQHAVMNWMMSNVTARIDRNDNVFPNKDSQDNKIDGPVALITAMSRAMLRENVGYHDTPIPDFVING